MRDRCPQIEPGRVAEVSLVAEAAHSRDAREPEAHTGPKAERGEDASRGQRAATTRISTRYLGFASRASTHARAGVCPGTTHLSHTEFISSK
jgi:hypothetical protein